MRSKNSPSEHSDGSDLHEAFDCELVIDKLREGVQSEAVSNSAQVVA